MNKKILILVDKIGEKKMKFASYISKGLPGEKVVLTEFSKLSIDLDGTNVSVRISGIKESISDFDMVYFRRVGNKYFSLAGTLAIILNYLKIPFYDTAFLEVGPDEDKFTNLTKLALSGLPVIPSFFCWPTYILENRKYIIGKFGLPLIAKSVNSHRGRGVYMLKSESDFELLIKNRKNQFLFQKFIHSDKEYRILVLKDKVAVAEEKIRTNPNEFRSNVALGAKEEFLNVGSISEKIKDISVKAAKLLKIQTAGVDILIDKVSGKPWLLEVNRGPGLTYDSKISPELDKFVEFFREELDIGDDGK